MKKVTFFASGLILLLCFCTITLVKNSSRPLCILYTGEEMGSLEPCGCTDGMLGGLPRRHTVIESIKQSQDGVLLLATGNVVSQAGRQDEIKYQIAISAMKQMGYQAVNIGYRDLTLGVDYLKYVQESFQAPLVCANLMKDGMPLFSQHKIVKIGKISVGIIGVISKKYQYLIDTQEPKLTLLEPQNAIKSVMKKIKGKVELVVLLGSMEIEEAKGVLQKFPSIKIALLSSDKDKPSCVMDFATSCIIATSSKKSEYLNKIDFYFNRNKREISDFSYEFIPLSEDIPDSRLMTQLMDLYQQMIGSEDLVRKVKRESLEGRKFVGSKTCQSCHGNVYSIWERTSHSKAYETLIKKGKQKDPECLSCHTVGFFYETGFVSEKETPNLIGVGCESCHGAGSEHIEKHETMGKVEKSSCAKCHTKEKSPNFSFDKYYPKILHWKDKD